MKTDYRKVTGGFAECPAAREGKESVTAAGTFMVKIRSRISLRTFSRHTFGAAVSGAVTCHFFSPSFQYTSGSMEYWRIVTREWNIW